MVNVTTVTDFLLMGFSDIWELQLIHATLFLLVYLAALMGNVLIIAITTLDRRFYTPMYFFLKHLSILDLCYISVTVPKSITNSLTNSCSTYYWGCVAQLFLTIMLAISELFILTVMSYDRYVAICRPLHYEVIMNRGACVQMAAATWFSGGLLGGMYSAGTFTLSFCRTNMIQQFFCDVPSLLNISCSERHIVVDVSVVIGNEPPQDAIDGLQTHRMRRAVGAIEHEPIPGSS
ncbi:olfactory receptor 14A16-like isoform X2 [Tachyglossus aculeatus]|uniref:olfactory receptor 14A16-like isoform X1 n=1 Tax=Tachyglossus aculeatus TaxID=9261 RepID=UPI0018F3948D|nr:olfactory receptor 14A16-like isoform X1 [Tachyglossus aculeatus]XP_038598982.1 olfactory receptor 14A16-like isoform X2 [Tachyglossus aculeatus]